MDRTGARSPGAAAAPDPEVSAKATRRRFSPRYKLSVVERADACETPGEIGELLRREGLYSSHLSAWRKAVREGSLEALARRRGAEALGGQGGREEGGQARARGGAPA